MNTTIYADSALCSSCEFRRNDERARARSRHHITRDSVEIMKLFLLSYGLWLSAGIRTIIINIIYGLFTVCFHNSRHERRTRSITALHRTTLYMETV